MDPNLEFPTKKQHSMFFFSPPETAPQTFQPTICALLNWAALFSETKQRCSVASAWPRYDPEDGGLSGGAEGHSQGLQTDIRPKPELKSY